MITTRSNQNYSYKRVGTLIFPPTFLIPSLLSAVTYRDRKMEELRGIARPTDAEVSARWRSVTRGPSARAAGGPAASESSVPRTRTVSRCARRRRSSPTTTLRRRHAAPPHHFPQRRRPRQHRDYRSPPQPHETPRDLLLLLLCCTAATCVTRSDLFRSVCPCRALASWAC